MAMWHGAAMRCRIIRARFWTKCAERPSQVTDLCRSYILPLDGEGLRKGCPSISITCEAPLSQSSPSRGKKSDRVRTCSNHFAKTSNCAHNLIILFRSCLLYTSDAADE